MIDLHCHIVPGVDDGAATMDESHMMAQMAIDSGVTAIAATPHFNLGGHVGPADSDSIYQSMVGLYKSFKEEHVDLKLYTGMEVFVSPEVPKLIKERKLLTLGGSHYLLVEFAFGESSYFADEMLKKIVREGLVPVIAHPERYEFIQEDEKHLFDWVNAGYILQVNKGSVLGSFGRAASKVAHWCLGEGCVHLIGSDAHSPYRRTTSMAEAYEYISEYNSPDIAEFLFTGNPSAILADKPIKPVLKEF